MTSNANLSGTSITLGNQSADTISFGTTTYNSGGAVSIAQDNALVVTGTHFSTPGTDYASRTAMRSRSSPAAFSCGRPPR